MSKMTYHVFHQAQSYDRNYFHHVGSFMVSPRLSKDPSRLLNLAKKRFGLDENGIFLTTSKRMNQGSGSRQFMNYSRKAQGERADW